MLLEGFLDVTPIMRAGVYALVAKGVVIYVGKSKAMMGRVNSHRSIWKAKRNKQEAWVADRLGIPGLLFDEVHVRPCRLDQVDELEKEMIDRYRPKYNIHLKPNGVVPLAAILARIGRRQPEAMVRRV